MPGVSTPHVDAVDHLPGSCEAGADNLCPACGYDLTGLPVDGTCPECGRAYTGEVVVVYGYGRGSFATESTARPRSLIWFALLAALNVAGVIGGPLRSVALVGLFVAVSFGISLWLRRTHSHPGTMQARFNRFGCVQHVNTVDPTARMISYLVPAALGLFLVANVMSAGFEAAMAAVVGAVVAVVVVGVIAVSVRASGRNRAGQIPGLIDDLHVTAATAWGATSRVSAERTREEGRYRLTVEAYRGNTIVRPVDIEVVATPGRIGALVERVRAWQAEVKAELGGDQR